MMPKQFQKNIEDFVCEHCGLDNKGNGYTNHCAKCLWSKHVDVNPGDRANRCLGMMEPISIRKKDGEFDILHRCTQCKFEKHNRVTKKDDPDIIVELSANI
jgi:hypothetical protein